jgi:hypothetical protein
LRGAFGGPVGVLELDEERAVADGGLRVAIVCFPDSKIAARNWGVLGNLRWAIWG